MNIKSVLQVVQGWVKVKGNTDGTLIGNVNDRLKVNIQGGQLPDEDIAIAGGYFEDSVTHGNDMAQDGSSTSIVYEIGPTVTDEVWYITNLSTSIVDSGNIRYNDFGAISSGLTNGILFQMTLNSTDYNVALFKTNDDLVSAFSSRFRGQSTAFINDSGYLNANRIVTGKQNAVR